MFQPGLQIATVEAFGFKAGLGLTENVKGLGVSGLGSFGLVNGVGPNSKPDAESHLRSQRMRRRCFEQGEQHQLALSMALNPAC